jgi:hypothetical protein
MVFHEKVWFSIGSHFAMGNPFLTFADWTESFFRDTYDYISEAVLRIFKNLTFFFFKLKALCLRMYTQFFGEENNEKHVEELVNSFCTPFWLEKHQRCIRCGYRSQKI